MSSARESDRHVLVAHPGAEMYGSDRVVLETVIGLVEDGQVVTVVLPEHGPLVEAMTSAGADVRIHPQFVLRKSLLRPRNWVSSLNAMLRSWRSAWKLMRDVRPSLLLVNTITLPLWPVLGRILRVPTVTHVHEAEGAASRIVLGAMYAPHLGVDGIVLNSEYSRSVITKVFPRLARRGRVIYNGVVGPPATVPARGSAPTEPHLLFLGRLSPRKGPDLVLRAAGALKQRDIDVRVTLLGATFDGYDWFERELRALIVDLGIEGRVEFAGFQDDIWPFLAQADIVVVPSRLDEPFGNTAVEAVLAGRPLIVSGTSGLREATADMNGVRQVPAGSAEAIADEAELLLANWSDLAEQVAQSVAVAERKFAPRRYRSDIVQYLNDYASD